MVGRDMKVAAGEDREVHEGYEGRAHRRGELMHESDVRQQVENHCWERCSSRTAPGQFRASKQQRRNGATFGSLLVILISGILDIVIVSGHRMPSRVDLVRGVNTVSGLRCCAGPPALRLFAPKDPEYVCNYDYSKDEQIIMADRVASAQRYRSYLSETNAVLFEQISRLVGTEHCNLVAVEEWPQYYGGGEKKVMESAHVLHDVPVVHDSEWREDVGQRYKELVPPKKRPPSMPSLNSKKMSISTSLSSSQSWTDSAARDLAPASNHAAVFLLDLDKCSLYGNDANDLGIALQWMDRKYEDVLALYRLLVNPCVKKTYEFLKEQYKDVKVVIYTMRATFLMYRSCFRSAIIPLQWDPAWHKDGQLYIPTHVKSAEDIMSSYCTEGVSLLQEEKVDLRKSLERLLAARQSIAETLGLSSLPETVVTATPKDVEATVTRLGYPMDHAYLWDDNARLRGSPRVITVPTFTSLPREQHGKVLDLLSRTLPPHTLETDLVEFMLGADPLDRVLHANDATGALEYRIPCADAHDAWPVPAPRTTPRRVPSRGADMADAAADAAAYVDGCASPVTPDLEAPRCPRAPCAAGGGGEGAAPAGLLVASSARPAAAVAEAGTGAGGFTTLSSGVGGRWRERSSPARR